MTWYVYVVWDEVAKEAGPLFMAKNDDVASRKFVNVLKEDKSMSKKEYSLYCLGTYDNEKMVIVSEVSREILAIAKDGG